MYCPSNAEWQNADTLWNFPTGDESTSIHSATGYQWLFRRPGFVNTTVPDGIMPPLFYGRQYLIKETDDQTLVVNGVTITNSPSTIDLATDMVNSSQGPPENFDGALATTSTRIIPLTWLTRDPLCRRAAISCTWTGTRNGVRFPKC